MNKVAVVIPIYKETPTSTEVNSLKQCLLVLRNYPIIFICAKNLNLGNYTSLLDNTIKYQFQLFEDKYFQSIEGYNSLMLEMIFYKTFISYKYILIHQLDSYVFKDELKYWCDEGYDYIGAPWFENFHDASPSAKIIGGGNGGFSLRRPLAHISLLQDLRRVEILRKYKDCTEIFLMRNFKTFLKEILKNKRSDFETNYDNQEDYFWTVDAQKFKNQKITSKNLIIKFFLRKIYPRTYRIAPDYKALRFSFEVNPTILFKITKELPFGCHAWERYDEVFWAKYLPTSHRNN